MTGRRLAQLAAIPVGELKGVGVKKVDALAAMEHPHRPRPAHPLPPALRRPHPPGRHRRPARWATRRWCWPRSSGCKSRRTRQGRMIVEVDVFDGTSYLHVVFFNQAWRAKQLGAGHPGRVLRQAGALPGPAPDDQPGRRPGRRPHRADRARLPAVGEGGAVHLGAGRVHRGGPGPGRALRRPPARGVARPPRPGRPAHAPSPPSTTRTRWRRPRPPAAGWSSTSCSGCSWPSSCASGPSSGSPRASATWSRAGGWCPGSTPACRSP